MTDSDPATQMFREARDAADIVAAQLAGNADTLAWLGALLKAQPPRTVMTCARGSSDHAATYLKHMVESRAGVLVASATPSIASIYGAEVASDALLAVGISQSGKSPDLIATMAAAKESGARTLALVNVTDSPLARMADIVLPLCAGPEKSVAATKSYIATLAASVALTAAWTGDAELKRALELLPDKLRTAFACDWHAMGDALATVRGLYVIGRGPGFGVAQEMALKFKETCGIHAEAFSAAEVRHGPMALVGPDLPLLVLRQRDEAADATDALISAACDTGATVLVASDAPASDRRAIHLPVPESQPSVMPILAVQAFYRAANALSVRRGFDPDRPPLLKKVTETV